MRLLPVCGWSYTPPPSNVTVRTYGPNSDTWRKSDPALTFGLGDDTRIRRLVIQRSSGQRHEVKGLAINRAHTIIEPQSPSTGSLPAILLIRDCGIGTKTISSCLADFALSKSACAVSLLGVLTPWRQTHSSRRPHNLVLSTEASRHSCVTPGWLGE
jgi:hypothetical protein